MVTIQGDKPITAIPTVYNGVQLRSRMEAKCAYLFDKLGWKWQYEPFSIMLDGINYMPDFYIPDLGYVVECRGYSSEKGERQISAFAKHVRSGGGVLDFKVERYVVIGPAEALAVDAIRESNLWFQFCPKCSSWIVWRHEGCKCGIEGHAALRKVTLSSGDILVDGKPSEMWAECAWDFIGVIRELLESRLCMARKALEATENEWLCRFISPGCVTDTANNTYGLGMVWPPSGYHLEEPEKVRKLLDAVFTLVDIDSDKFWFQEGAESNA